MIVIAETYRAKDCWGCGGGKDPSVTDCPVCKGKGTYPFITRIFEDGSTQEEENGVTYLRKCGECQTGIPSTFDNCPYCASDETARRAMN